MLKTFLYLTFLFAFLQNTNAQDKPVERYELDLHHQFSECGTIAFGEDGVFLYCKKIKPMKSDFIWTLSIVDTNLTMVKEVDFAVGKSAILRSVHNDETFVYFIFTKGAKEMMVYRINHLTMLIDMVHTETITRCSSIIATSYEDNLFILGKSMKASEIYKCNFQDNTVNKSEVKFARTISSSLFLNEMFVDTISKELVLSLEIQDDLQYQSYIYSYDLQLKLLDIFDPEIYTKNKIHAIHVRAIAPNKYVYTGTYSLEKEDVIEGVFCFGIVDRNTLFLERFIPLNQLDAFKRYLNEDGGETKELRKAQRDLITAVHDVYYKNNYYFLVTEFYGKTYKTSVGATIIFGSLGALATLQFDGFLYKGSDLIAINEEGDVTWDLFLNLYPRIKPFTENLLVDIEVEENKIDVSFPVNDEMRNMAFNNDGNILSQKTEKIPELAINLKRWYGEVFVNSDYFNKYIVFNAESITDKVTVKHNAFFIEKYRVSSR